MASPSGFLCGTITIFWALEKIDLTVAISTEFMRPNIQYYTKVLGSPFLFLAPGTLPIRIFLGSREPGPFLRGALLDKDHGMDGPGFKSPMFRSLAAWNPQKAGPGTHWTPIKACGFP